MLSADESNNRVNEEGEDEEEGIPYWYRHRPAAISIETTSYALLALLHNGYIHYCHPIAAWLVTQRNGKGGFISTQDTIVALEALSEYSSMSVLPELDLECELRADHNQTFVERVTISEHNALVHQHHTVPTGGNLYVETSGKGLGQLQVEMRYNVPDKDDNDVCSFELSIESREHREHQHVYHHDVSDLESVLLSSSTRGRRIVVYQIEIRVCMKHLKNVDAGMTILDVGLFTGFIVDAESLKQLINDPSHYVQRYETTRRAVILYLDSVPSSRDYCVEIIATRVHNAGMIQPVPVRIYDYYEPDESCTAFYHPVSNSPLLDTICFKEDCRCAEGNCAQCYGDGRLDLEPKVWRELQALACQMDFAYIAKVHSPRLMNSFQRYPVTIQRALKSGVDQVIPGSKRHFFNHIGCQCPQFISKGEYLIIGKNGFRFKKKSGETVYKYFLDHEFYIEKVCNKRDLKAGQCDRATYSKMRTLVRRVGDKNLCATMQRLHG